ncbi:MAG: PhoH family protein [Anaerolineaceae bacterium]
MSSNKRLSKAKRNQITREQDYLVNRKFAMKRITPMTDNQCRLFQSYAAGKHIASIGSAGTGKTFASMYLALKDVMEKGEYERIIIVRSAVQSREQGFMPGSLAEKMSYYEAPYMDIVNDLFERKDAYQIMKQKGMITFMSTSFVRGLTFDNSIIIVDEVQNQNFQEINTIATRVGHNSRLLLCGDVKQDDLKTSRNTRDNSGLGDFLKVARKMSCFDIIEFQTDDIVRSGFVKEYIIAKERTLELA